MTGVEPYAPLSVAQLVDLQLPEREDIVEGGLLVAGSVTLFAAREKSGKTMLCTDLACCIVSEEPFLDRAVRCGPALFIALEENIREVRQRILDRLGSRLNVPLYVLPANGFTEEVFRLDDPACMAAFKATIEGYGITTVIIDTMREAHGLREDVADDMALLNRPLRQIAHATNCAIVLLHHMSKAGTARGSTAIAAAADQLWTFQRNERQHEQVSESDPAGLLSVEGRFGPRQTLGIRLGTGLRWEVDTLIAHQDDRIRGRVLAALREGSPAGMTAPEIAAVLDAKLKSVQNEISRVLQETPAPIVAHGVPRRGEPRRYLVVDPALFPIPNSLGNGNWERSEQNHSHASGNDGNDQTAIVPKGSSSRGWEPGMIVEERSGAATAGGHEDLVRHMAGNILMLSNEERRRYRQELDECADDLPDVALHRAAMSRAELIIETE